MQKKLLVTAAAITMVSACARVELNGPIVGSSVSIFHSSESEPIYTDMTGEWGGPNRKVELLVSGSGFIDMRGQDFSKYTGSGIFIVEASGGQRTGDDADLKLSDPEDFNGTVHLVVPARDSDLKTGRLNGQTEMVYQAIKPLLDSGASDADILAALDSLAASLMNEDLSGDGVINYRDFIMASHYAPDAQFHSLEELQALSEAIFSGDTATISAAARDLTVCNYTQTTPGGSFPVCETAHDAASCAGEDGGEFVFGHCASDGVVGTCTGSESTFHYYSGDPSSLSFGCNFVPGGVWTTP